MDEVLIHAFKDSFYMLPFLFAAYLIIEFIEQSSSQRMQGFIARLGRFGSLGGALLGCVPQCGFSAAAANFYSNRVITLGTLVAVFLSTSDEAVAVLVSYPEQRGTIVKLIAVKIIVAAVAGFFLDMIFKSKPDAGITAVHLKHEHCHRGKSGFGAVFTAALKHTAVTYTIIFIITALLGWAMDGFGEARMSAVMMSGSWFQPFIAAIVGFIPNCASSVLLTQLYVSGTLSLGSLVAGLCTGAGVGLVVLFKENRPIKENFKIMGIMYVISVVAGLLF